MDSLEMYYFLILGVQLIHSIEELSSGFHKKWYLFKMSFSTFLIFEISFSLFWIIIGLYGDFPFRNYLQAFFLILMFANGVQHIVWAGFAKKYVPGLVTAPLLILVFLLFYFRTAL